MESDNDIALLELRNQLASIMDTSHPNFLQEAQLEHDILKFGLTEEEVAAIDLSNTVAVMG